MIARSQIRPDRGTMSDISLGPAPTTGPEPDAELIGRAKAVLDANWLGHATSPSPRLYPHQWSWDAACIAMGYASWNQPRAEQELRSLFSGQWRNGLLPHIVFTDGARYFPGPDFWEVDLSPDAPEQPRTSGIVQPPIHATAVWQVYRARRRPAASGVLPGRLFPQSSGMARVPLPPSAAGTGTVSPRSGTRGSREWTIPRSGTRRSTGCRWTPPDPRVPSASTCGLADASERPSDAEYDRYVYLVELFRAARVRALAGSGTRCHSRSSPSSSTPSSSARTATWPRSRGSWAPTRLPPKPGRRPRPVGSGQPVGRGSRPCTWTTTSSRRSEWASATAAGLAPLYGKPARNRARSGWSNAWRARACRSAPRLAVTSLLARRSRLPADALLAIDRYGRF